MSVGVPILMYHQVTPRPLTAFRTYTVTPAVFAAHMRCLQVFGYTPITFDTLLDARGGHGTLPKRPVIITFDDGFRDSYEYAVPILESHGFTAVFFLVAGLIGKTSVWMRSQVGIELPLFDWATARELAARGYSCGAHTLNHVYLAQLSTAACRDELAGARRLLADMLGQEVWHMAYPNGSYNERVRTLVAEVGYRSASSSRRGLSFPDDDPFALHRVVVKGEETLVDFLSHLRYGQPARAALRMHARGVYHWARRLGTQ